ncbi:hypothetical protein AX14_011948 [Amanita brunnescens Koide BX004]|nr:hypothetical protein AX14_011948 [Amanita brunnescens Koide BX004]
MATIRISDLLLHHFAESSNTFTFRYCPSHSGIEGNDRADRLTNDGAAIAPIVPPRILLSNFVNDFTKRMSLHWRVLFSSRTFRGHQWLPIRRRKKVFKPAINNKASTNFFINLADNDMAALSRMARAATNHAPTGEYRQRFYPELEHHCPACPQLIQTRTHILFHCSRYVPLHSSITDWSRDRSNDKSWKLYFQRNTSSFTFGDLPDDVH